MSPIDPTLPPAPPPPPPPPGTGGFDLGAAFSWAWKKFTENVATLVLITLIFIVISGVLSGLGNSVSGNTSFSMDPDAPTSFDAGRFAAGTLIGLVGSIVSALLGANLARVGLIIADGGKPGVGELFSFPKLGATAVVALLLAVIGFVGTVVGLLLCILPGLIFALVFAVATAFTYFFHFDANQDGLDPIKSSANLVKDNLGEALLALIVAFVVGVAGVCLCGVGLLVTIPVALLIVTYTYRNLTGGTVVA